MGVELFRNVIEFDHGLFKMAVLVYSATGILFFFSTTKETRLLIGRRLPVDQSGAWPLEPDGNRSQKSNDRHQACFDLT